MHLELRHSGSQQIARLFGISWANGGAVAEDPRTSVGSTHSRVIYPQSYPFWIIDEACIGREVFGGMTIGRLCSEICKELEET